MRKIFYKLHLWLSIPFGVIISIICLTGAVLVFEKEVMEVLYHDLYYVTKIEDKKVPLEQLMTIVEETLPDSITISGVNISSSPNRAYQVMLSKPRSAAIYIDQYTGVIKGRYERTSFFTFMFKMHRWLLDSVKPGGTIFYGKVIVGISTLAFVFILISGIVIWIPRTYKALKNRVKISTSKGIRRFFYDSHVVVGGYFAILLLIMALTGLTWSFPWYRTGFYKVFGVESVARGNSLPQTRTRGEKQGDRESQHHIKEKRHTHFDHWQQVYDELCKLRPDYKQINIKERFGSVSVGGFGNSRATDRYEFNPVNGEIIQESLYKQQNRSEKMRGWIYSVHVGNWGGIFTRIFYFLAALLGGTLPLTGYYLWIKKQIRGQKTKNIE